MHDLILCQKVGHPPRLFIREWAEIKRSHEFRCFVKGGRLMGISQYYYQERHTYLDSVFYRSAIENQAHRLLDEMNQRISMNDFIFDIAYQPDSCLPLLIEINPYSSWTDPCLFDWATDKFQKFEFRWVQSLRGDQNENP